MARRPTHLVGVKHDAEQLVERCFIHYSPPPSITADGNFVLGAKEDWLERIEFFIGDVTWLLELNQKEFWDQMISNEKAMLAIISFLQEATPHYMLDTFPIDEDMWKQFQKAQFLVFLIFNRLTTCVESDNEILTTDKIGKMLYNNYLITIPIILDLCLIYGQSNRAQISTIVNNIFEMQPNYTEDLIKAVPYFSKVLHNVEKNIAGSDKALHNGELAKLSERSGVGTLKGLQDCIFHVLDMATNLSIFLDIYTPACHILHEQLFENTMVTFYENTLPALYERLVQVANTPNTQLIYADLRHKLDLARVEMLKIFRLILSSIVSRVVEQSSGMSEEETKELAEDYVNVLTAAVAEKTFVRDYHTAYPVDLDLDILSQLCPEMDALKCDYVLEAVLACFETPPQRNAGNADARDTHLSSSVSSTTTTATMPSRETAVVASTTKPAKRVGGVKLESLISQVKDILPHLGDGFVLSCLEHFDYATDSVINAVLEDALPGNLKAMDFSMPRTINLSTEDDDLSKGLQRLNVFDNDEFDIMTRDDVDMSRIHLGKKREEHRDLAALLDDKRHRAEFRDTYTKLGLVDANVDAGLYDDEYDDTYDHVDVSVAEAGETERRPFVVPRVLRTQEAESSSEGEAAAPSGAAGEYVRPPPGTFVPFVQNPEEVRARAEERRLSKRGGRGPYKGGDVVGVAKGHGQEKNVTISREKKTQRGNQNRRSGAARKRNQGMIPS